MRVYALLAIVPTTLVVGCGNNCESSLGTDWAGEFECEGVDATYEMVLYLDGSEYTAIGTGAMRDFLLGYNTDVYEGSYAFAVTISKVEECGEQDLEVDLDDCELELDATGSSWVPCDETEDVTWDGEDTIEGRFPAFLETVTVGGGVACEFWLTR